MYGFFIYIKCFHKISLVLFDFDRLIKQLRELFLTVLYFLFNRYLNTFQFFKNITVKIKIADLK